MGKWACARQSQINMLAWNHVLEVALILPPAGCGRESSFGLDSYGRTRAQIPTPILAGNSPTFTPKLNKVSSKSVSASFCCVLIFFTFTCIMLNSIPPHRNSFDRPSLKTEISFFPFSSLVASTNDAPPSAHERERDSSPRPLN